MKTFEEWLKEFNNYEKENLPEMELEYKNYVLYEICDCEERGSEQFQLISERGSMCRMKRKWNRRFLLRQTWFYTLKRN